MQVPKPTSSGWLDIDTSLGSQAFFAYYEARQSVLEDAPIVLWLQGGPGCSSFFG